MLKSGCAANVALRSRRKEGQPKRGGKKGKKGSPKEEESPTEERQPKRGGKPNRGKKGSPKEEERKAAQKRRKANPQAPCPHCRIWQIGSGHV